MRGGGEVMRYSFTEKDMFFSRKRLAGGSQLTLTEERERRMGKEKRSVVTTAIASQCG